MGWYDMLRRNAIIYYTVFKATRRWDIMSGTSSEKCSAGPPTGPWLARQRFAPQGSIPNCNMHTCIVMSVCMSVRTYVCVYAMFVHYDILYQKRIYMYIKMIQYDSIVFAPLYIVKEARTPLIISPKKHVKSHQTMAGSWVSLRVSVCVGDFNIMNYNELWYSQYATCPTLLCLTSTMKAWHVAAAARGGIASVGRMLNFTVKRSFESRKDDKLVGEMWNHNKLHEMT